MEKTLPAGAAVKPPAHRTELTLPEQNGIGEERGKVGATFGDSHEKISQVTVNTLSPMLDSFSDTKLTKI